MSKNDLLRLSFDVPEGWSKPLQQAAQLAGYKSVSAYVRSLIAAQLGVEPPEISWGGKRDYSLKVRLRGKTPILKPSDFRLEDLKYEDVPPDE